MATWNSPGEEMLQSRGGGRFGKAAGGTYVQELAEWSAKGRWPMMGRWRDAKALMRPL